jgi:hypothetical protein
LSPELFVIDAALPAVPVAVNVNGLPVSPVALAVSVFDPAVGPSVQDVTAAIPLAPVVTGVVGLTIPPPDATANVTPTPWTGLLLASLAITDGGVATAVPVVVVWLLPAFTAIWVAVPAVTVTVPDVTGVSVPLENVSVRGPMVPEMTRLVKTAWPLAFVVTGTVPPSVPPPVAIITPTDAGWLTAFPEPSWSWITGCCGNTIPFCTVLDGCVVTASRVAAPAVPVAVNVTGLPVSPVALAVSVFGPAVEPRVHDVAAAMPLAPVVTDVVGATLPPPDAMANVTATPATGLLFASRTITDGGVATAVPTVADWPLPAFTAIEPAVPAVPVAVNVTGLPLSVPDVAVRVFVPAVGPKVQLVTAATPLAFVVTAVVGLTVPPPEATAKVTGTPATGLLNASRTITPGGVATAVPAVAVWLLPALTAIALAAAAVTVTVAVCVTASVPFTVAVTVFAPAAVELSVPVTCPLALVVPTGCVSVLPAGGVAPSVTVAPLTGLAY